MENLVAKETLLSVCTLPRERTCKTQAACEGNRRTKQAEQVSEVFRHAKFGVGAYPVHKRTSWKRKLNINLKISLFRSCTIILTIVS